MSLTNVTITVGTVDHVYAPTSVLGNQVLFTKIGADPKTPEIMEWNRTPGTTTKPTRVLVKLSNTQQNSETLEIETSSTHEVLTIGPKQATTGRIQDLQARLNALMTDARVASMVAGYW